MPKITKSLTKPSNSAFKQQRLKACQPILTPTPVISTFFIIGLVFLPLGILFYYTSQNIQEVEARYDHICNDTCIINFTGLKMKAPVYMYYKLGNFYQNHRRYVKSRNDDQLRGQKVYTVASLTDCQPLASLNGSSNPQHFYLPCGLIANSMFNDSFALTRTGNLTALPLRKRGIAWESDKGNKFANPTADTVGIRVIPDFEDEDFIVWMRTAALPTFKKLYRIIDHDLNGDYSVHVTNNFPVSRFQGSKSVVISEISWLGGKNPFLGIAYMATGATCLVLGMLFLIKHKVSGRKLGDTSYLEWQ